MKTNLKISFFRHFGAGNFGNRSTLEARLCHICRSMPDAEITCIRTAPETVAGGYKIAAVPFTTLIVKPWMLRNPLARLARETFIGIPSKLYRWLMGAMTLRNTDMLIFVGAGLLTDAFGISGWRPYSTFKWSVIAKMSACRLAFLSVRAGPMAVYVPV